MYLLLIPGLVFLLLFKYTPMYGIVIAFQDFNIFGGISGSEWVGVAQFERLLQSDEFLQVLINTLLISLYKITILFPIPIVIALMLNEVRRMFFKRTIQTIIYLPHFLSWVIISGLFLNILSPTGGIVNEIIRSFGGEPISFYRQQPVPQLGCLHGRMEGNRLERYRIYRRDCGYRAGAIRSRSHRRGGADQADVVDFASGHAAYHRFDVHPADRQPAGGGDGTNFDHV